MEQDKEFNDLIKSLNLKTVKTQPPIKREKVPESKLKESIPKSFTPQVKDFKPPAKERSSPPPLPQSKDEKSHQHKRKSPPTESKEERASWRQSLFPAAPATTEHHHRPFRPKRNFPPDTKLQSLLKFAENVMDEGRLKTAVTCPPNVELNDWLQVNAVLYYNRVNDMYGYLDEHEECQCERMTISNKYEYLWADGKTIRNPISISANDYIDYLMTWIEANFDDTKFFPDYDNGKRGHGYFDLIKDIFKRLFRVLGHMETLHHERLVAHGISEMHDLTFRTFIEFVKAYKLMDKKSFHTIRGTIDRWKAEKRKK